MTLHNNHNHHIITLRQVIVVVFYIAFLSDTSIRFLVPTKTVTSLVLASSISRRKSHILHSIQLRNGMPKSIGRKRKGLIEAVTSSMTDSSEDDNNRNDSDNQDDDVQENPSSSSITQGNNINKKNTDIGRLEALKQLELELASQLALVRREKVRTIQSRPLTIGIIGYGRFGQFIAKTFARYGNVIVTSRSDYTELARSMGATYIPLSDPEQFLQQGLDVIVVAVSIVSFDSTIQMIAPYIQTYIEQQQRLVQQTGATTTATACCVHGPLIVDVLSVKEHPRNIMLHYLPIECDILCTHPMFGPDSGKDSWRNLNFVYERTRIDKVVLSQQPLRTSNMDDDTFVDEEGHVHSVHEDSDAHIEGMDRIERFLSIWEEEGCHMVPLSCSDHDAYAANSQFVTHLIGRVLGSQGLTPTPIDTSGFQSVLKLVDTTTADSFDLFYGLYKYNQNSVETIKKLQTAMNDVVQNLQVMEQDETKR
jgi:arogenate dehydrogenase (NADP+), plant